MVSCLHDVQKKVYNVKCNRPLTALNITKTIKPQKGKGIHKMSFLGIMDLKCCMGLYVDRTPQNETNFYDECLLYSNLRLPCLHR